MAPIFTNLVKPPLQLSFQIVTKMTASLIVHLAIKYNQSCSKSPHENEATLNKKRFCGQKNSNFSISCHKNSTNNLWHMYKSSNSGNYHLQRIYMYTVLQIIGTQTVTSDISRGWYNHIASTYKQHTYMYKQRGSLMDHSPQFCTT